MRIIETDHLTKRYTQGDEEIYAVKDTSIAIHQGEFVAIVGQSGSGKTTLLNMIGGIDKPTSGTVKIEGIELSSLDNKAMSRIRRQKIGYIFQDFHLIPILTAEENIVMPLLLDGKQVDCAYFNEIVALLGIEKRLKHLPSQLSGGQRQRVAIARALINKPSVILADEPTGNLDKKAADEIIELLFQINKRGNTVLLVTHENSYAERCDRRLVIVEGGIVGR
ncbi:MAG: ABC transporter ATP-binding protein [Oscillospiraceae bacterium]|jgi:putative ABC transport system ATP-binding protein|nr:ABC transporter ATP-binding protein [Oscillospiraceae bacterium]